MALAFHELKISNLKRETKDALSVSFDVPKELEEEFLYLPGQHLTFKFPYEGKILRRSYSISGSHYFDEPLTITVKRVKDGRISNHINDTAAVGQTIEVMKPAGNFYAVPDPDKERNFVLLAGGSGITPMMSISKAILLNEPKSKIFLLYMNNDEESIIFKEQFDRLQQKYPAFNVIHILSKPSDSWQGETGFMTKERTANKIKELLQSDVQSAEYYVCGPKILQEILLDGLGELGIKDDKIHTEIFISPADTETETKVSESDIEKKIKIKLYGDEHIVGATENESVLEAALRAGLEPPFSCQLGACATCRALLVSGKVEMENSDALTDDEINEGFILTCQAHPLTDEISVDYDY